MSLEKIQEVAKMIVAGVGAVLAVGSVLIPVDWSGYLGLGVAVLTTFATYKIPNANQTVITVPAVEPSRPSVSEAALPEGE